MMYWVIAGVFFLVSVSACLISLVLHEDIGPGFEEAIVAVAQRVGICAVVAVTWPLSVICAIAIAVDNVLRRHGATEEYDD